jgi:hypothetical protein
MAKQNATTFNVSIFFVGLENEKYAERKPCFNKLFK